MTMPLASDYWQVVGDASCGVLVGVPEPVRNLCTKFLMQFRAEIKLVTSDEADRLLDNDVIPRVISREGTIELDGSNSSNMDADLSETLRRLLVPMEKRSSMVEKIMIKASEAARKRFPYSSGKRVRMWVNIGLTVIDDDDDDDDEDANGGGIVGDYYEPRFVPASAMAIEKLERTRVQVP